MSADEWSALIVGDDLIDELAVSFHDCEWGWIHVGIAPLDHGWCACCTHIVDPFPAMLEWLESIADGADCAQWIVGEEGCAMRFVFLSESRGFLAEGAPMLLLARCGFGVSRTAAWAVEPDVLIRSFYGAFRSFVDSADYRPEHWEAPNTPEVEIPDDATEEEYKELMRLNDKRSSWDGSRLRDLRSAKLDALIGEAGAA